ncbi:MAG: MlrC C-terminal domain-containing protein [Baekduia sp.]
MDRAAVAACIAAGVGATVTLQRRRQARRAARRAGRGDRHGAADPRGLVRDRRGDGSRARAPVAGKTVVLEIDGPGGIELQLTELRGHPNDLNYFRAFGIEPTERRILVLKSAAHFRAAFEPIATKVIEIDAPGISSPNLHSFPYQRPAPPDLPAGPGDDLGAGRRWGVRA